MAVNLHSRRAPHSGAGVSGHVLFPISESEAPIAHLKNITGAFHADRINVTLVAIEKSLNHRTKQCRKPVVRKPTGRSVPAAESERRTHDLAP